jgi:hypothetical protein
MRTHTHTHKHTHTDTHTHTHTHKKHKHTHTGILFMLKSISKNASKNKDFEFTNLTMVQVTMQVPSPKLFKQAAVDVAVKPIGSRFLPLTDTIIWVKRPHPPSAIQHTGIRWGHHPQTNRRSRKITTLNHPTICLAVLLCFDPREAEPCTM